MLVLDDLHLADQNTLALLARVARGAAGERLLVLGAYRDADAVGTPLLGAIADLRRDCDVERVPVEGLSLEEVSALLDGAADARRIYDRTDGNPFFVRELARHLAERRDAADDVPESVSDVVLARVGRLSRGSADALTAASVLGESFELPTLELLGERGRARRTRRGRCSGARRRRGGRLFSLRPRTHARRRLRLDRLERRAELHRRAAAALERVHGLEPGPGLAAIALHLFESARAEDVARAVELAERAAAWALERDGYEQVVTLLTRALAVLAEGCRPPPVDTDRAIAFARLTHALFDRPLATTRGGASPDFGRRHVVDELEEFVITCEPKASACSRITSSVGAP